MLRSHRIARLTQVHPIFLARCPAFRQGTLCQIEMLGVEVTSGQPQKAKLNYIYIDSEDVVNIPKTKAYPDVERIVRRKM